MKDNCKTYALSRALLFVEDISISHVHIYNTYTYIYIYTYINIFIYIIQYSIHSQVSDRLHPLIYQKFCQELQCLNAASTMGKSLMVDGRCLGNLMKLLIRTSDLGVFKRETPLPGWLGDNKRCSVFVNTSHAFSNDDNICKGSASEKVGSDPQSKCQYLQ